LKIPEIEGECIVEGPELESVKYENPLRMHIVNIGMKDNPKFANIRD